MESSRFRRGDVGRPWPFGCSYNADFHSAGGQRGRALLWAGFHVCAKGHLDKRDAVLAQYAVWQGACIELLGNLSLPYLGLLVNLAL